MRIEHKTFQYSIWRKKWIIACSRLNSQVMQLIQLIQARKRNNHSSLILDWIVKVMLLNKGAWMHSSLILDWIVKVMRYLIKVHECGSNTRPSNIQFDALPTKPFQIT